MQNAKKIALAIEWRADKAGGGALGCHLKPSPKHVPPVAQD